MVVNLLLTATFRYEKCPGSHFSTRSRRTTRSIQEDPIRWSWPAFYQRTGKRLSCCAVGRPGDGSSRIPLPWCYKSIPTPPVKFFCANRTGPFVSTNGMAFSRVATLGWNTGAAASLFHRLINLFQRPQLSLFRILVWSLSVDPYHEPIVIRSLVLHRSARTLEQQHPSSVVS